MVNNDCFIIYCKTNICAAMMLHLLLFKSAGTDVIFGISLYLSVFHMVPR